MSLIRFILIVSAVAAITVISIPRYGSSAEPVSLGIGEISRPESAEWVMDETLAVNHEARFTQQNTNDVLTFSLYVLTDYEKQLPSAKDILRFVNANWFAKLVDEGKAVRESGRGYKKTGEGNFEFESMAEYFEKGQVIRILRKYVYISGQDIIFVMTLRTDRSAPERTDGYFYFHKWPTEINRMDASALSPCVRLGFIKQQFQDLAEAYNNGKNPKLIQQYADTIRIAATTRLAAGDKHCEGPLNYLLGTIESYNQDWELYGSGFNREAALKNFQNAEQVRPGDPQVKELIHKLKTYS